MKKLLCVFLSTLMTISGLVYASGAEPVYGDSNNDQVVDILDVGCVLDKVLTGKTMPVEENPDYMEYVDLNKDGVINTADVAEILQMVLDSGYIPDGVPVTESTTEITTEETTETTTDATTETTTDATTETTTEETTEMTTEPVTGTRNWNMSNS